MADVMDDDAGAGAGANEQRWIADEDETKMMAYHSMIENGISEQDAKAEIERLERLPKEERQLTEEQIAAHQQALDQFVSKIQGQQRAQARWRTVRKKA